MAKLGEDPAQGSARSLAPCGCSESVGVTVIAVVTLLVQSSPSPDSLLRFSCEDVSILGVVTWLLVSLPH